MPDSTIQVVERWYGRERLSQGQDYWIDFLATESGLAIEDWLARPARLLTRSADGGQIVRAGLINEAEQLDSDGGLARYRVRLVGWSWWLSQGRHSRVFQERGVREIVESVFADYGTQAAWRWSSEVDSFLAQARPRSYCVQYRERDSDFVARLLAEEGLGWRIEVDAQAPGGHRLVIFADSAGQDADPSSAAAGAVRYHRSDATEASDSVLALGRQQQLGAGQLTLLSHDYRSGRATTSQLPLAGGEQAALRELYEPVGQYAFASAAEADRYAGLLAQADEAQWAGWQGRGAVRSFRAGQWFALSQWPGAAEPPELLLTEVEHLGVNNLPLAAREALERALPAPPPPLALPEAVQAIANRVGYRNHFQAVERRRPWRPVLRH